MLLKNNPSLALAGDFLSAFRTGKASILDKIIKSFVQLYPEAILTGAVAVSKHLKNPIQPRVTYNVDFFLRREDYISLYQSKTISKKFLNFERDLRATKYINFSLRHKATDIAVNISTFDTIRSRKKTAKFILRDLDNCLELCKIAGKEVYIFRPELIMALKLQQIVIRPKSIKGLSNTIDIMNLLESCSLSGRSLDLTWLRDMLNRREFNRFKRIYCNTLKRKL